MWIVKLNLCINKSNQNRIYIFIQYSLYNIDIYTLYKYNKMLIMLYKTIGVLTNFLNNIRYRYKFINNNMYN